MPRLVAYVSRVNTALWRHISQDITISGRSCKSFLSRTGVVRDLPSCLLGLDFYTIRDSRLCHLGEISAQAGRRRDRIVSCRRRSHLSRGVSGVYHFPDFFVLKP